MKRELIDHKYQIIEELGRGSLAIVYRAKDISLDREVAIKLLDPGLLAREDVEPTLASRFAREAKTTANLQHPNIIDIHEYGEHEGQPFIVMPFLPGASLDKLIRERGALDPAQVLRITEQVGAALDHMHRHGVVHQNIKPSKILFDKDGQAILTDLGGAKVVNESTALTQGRTLGTPYYMPPEQWQGQEMDARSDLYALGVVIYQMLTGRLPFEGNTTSVMQGHLKERPPSPQFMNTSLPRSVDTVLLKALDKDPEKRYQTASQLVIHLKAALADTKKTGVVDKKPSRRFTFVWIVAAALVLLAICGCGGVIFAGMNGSGPAVALFATETLTVTNTPTSTPTATPTSTNTVTPTPTPTKTPTLTLMPTETPIPTNTPTPIPSDTPTYVPSTAIPQQVTIPPTPVPPPSNFQLAYTKFDGTFHNIYIADINGQNEQLIIARAGSPSFSPDNRLYFFGEQGVNQQRDRQNPDPATASILCDFPTISGGIVAIDLMSPLSDICDVQAGLWACFRKGPGDDVCTANNISIFQNLDWKVGTARVVTVAPVNPLVAYDAIPSGDIYRIYFRNAIDFGGPANTEILGEHPSWSPDGQRLAYRSGRENKFGIWVSNRDDTEHDWVVWNSPSHPALSPSFPTWSPDNRTIAFSGLGDQGGQDIFIRPWDKSTPEQNLTNSSSNDTLPIFTPDGGQIIFRSDRGGSWGIWRMNSDGSNPVLIIPNAPVGIKWEFSKMDIKSASVPSDAAIVAVPTTIPTLTVPPPPPAIPTITMPPGILAGDSSRDFRASPITEGEWRYVWAEAYNTGWWLPTVDGGNGCFATDHPDFDFAICQETIRNKSRAEVAVQWKPLLDGDWLVEWDASQFRFFHRGDFIRSEGPGPTLPNSATFTELVRDWDDFFWAAPPDVEFSYHIRIYYLGQQE